MNNYVLGKFGQGAIQIINSSIESVGQAAGKVKETVKETINESVNIIEDIKSILFWAGMITVLILILIFIWFAAPYCLMGMKFARIIQTTIGRPKNKKKITVAALQKEEKEEIPMEEVEAYILTYMPKICTIINKRRNKRPHFIVSINGRQLHALLDSGSDVTFCTKEIAQTLNLNIDETKCCKAEGIGAVQVPFIGSAVAEICVEEISIKAEIQISKDGWCPAEIVLGSDFLKKINQTHDININLQRKMIKIGETQIPLLVSTSEEQRSIKMEDQQIPSNSNENPPSYNQEIEFPTDFYKKNQFRCEDTECFRCNDPMRRSCNEPEQFSKICTIHSKKTKRPHINVTVNGSILRALFDSGSDITYCSEQTARRLNLRCIQTNTPIAEGIGNVRVPFIGTATTEIMIGSMTVIAQILIAKDGWCPAQLLVGSDLIQKINKSHDISINLQK